MISHTRHCKTKSEREREREYLVKVLGVEYIPSLEELEAFGFSFQCGLF